MMNIIPATLLGISSTAVTSTFPTPPIMTANLKGFLQLFTVVQATMFWLRADAQKKEIRSK